MGRMALTNYLMQTIICITIFYGVGFGLGGNIGPVIFIPIGIGIYTLQVLYSHLWLKYFNYGPFECVIEIPAGYELSQAKAAYQNGFLRVEVPQVPGVSQKLVLVAGSDSK